MIQQNQVYFDLEQFARDIRQVKIARKATYKDIAIESNTTVSIVSNLFNSCRCSAETLAALCGWANLDPRNYFIVNPLSGRVPNSIHISKV